MNKDEIKNRISLALKDPILQQGFEVICKENAELKEQNANLIAMLKFEREVRVNDDYLLENFMNNKLAKAKEIIKDFVDRDDSCWSIQKRAEEFLKEM